MSGGSRVGVHVLARAGRLAGEPEALARAAAMLAWPRAPWCPEIF